MYEWKINEWMKDECMYEWVSEWVTWSRVREAEEFRGVLSTGSFLPQYLITATRVPHTHTHTHAHTIQLPLDIYSYKSILWVVWVSEWVSEWLTVGGGSETLAQSFVKGHGCSQCSVWNSEWMSDWVSDWVSCVVCCVCDCMSDSRLSPSDERASEWVREWAAGHQWMAHPHSGRGPKLLHPDMCPLPLPLPQTPPKPQILHTPKTG